MRDAATKAVLRLRTTTGAQSANEQDRVPTWYMLHGTGQEQRSVNAQAPSSKSPAPLGGGKFIPTHFYSVSGRSAATISTSPEVEAEEELIGTTCVLVSGSPLAAGRCAIGAAAKGEP